MRTHPSPRWLALALLAALTVAGIQPAYAAPLQQEYQISVVAFVDVAPATDPNCPGCNGEFDAEDSDYAQNNPLPPMTFAVRDSTGQEIARQDTSELTVGIQRTLFTVPEGPEFTVEMVVGPPGWQLCPNESTTRILTEDDFQLSNAREEFHFTQGCNVSQATATPQPGVPTHTPEPGRPTNTPMPGQPTKAPGGGTGGDGGGTVDKTDPQLGYIKGFACIDANNNGKVDPTDPGLNDVRVKLSGGSTQLYAVTPGTGAFSFDGLGPGRYELSVSPGPEWRVTTQSMYVVELAAGKVVQGIDFCMVRGGQSVAQKVIAGSGVRLPDTGFASLPAAPLLGAATLLLGVLGALGMSVERRRKGRQ